MPIPEDFKEIDLGMSNCFHKIDDGFEDAIIDKPTYGRHAGWDFNGMVYYKDGKFHEDVWVYRCYQETISKKTLQSLMSAVNDKYGWN